MVEKVFILNFYVDVQQLSSLCAIRNIAWFFWWIQKFELALVQFTFLHSVTSSVNIFLFILLDFYLTFESLVFCNLSQTVEFFCRYNTFSSRICRYDHGENVFAHLTPLPHAHRAPTSEITPRCVGASARRRVPASSDADPATLRC